MDSDTKHMNRLLILWLDLDRARAASGHDCKAKGLPRCEPWTCKNETASQIWRKLTEPANLLALEFWHLQAADGQAAEWARKALEECRQREKAGGKQPPGC
jgi:hypothetical protein